MYAYQIYWIAFVVSDIVIAFGIIFLAWRYQVHKRKKLYANHKDSAIIRLRTKSFQGFDCASSIKIRKVDGEKADSFLYQWPGKRAVYVRPGVHRLEVRADWPVRARGACWFHYTVETLPEVRVEAGMHYALEYEVRTDTWTLFEIGPEEAPDGKEKVSERFVKPEGYVSDNHIRVWNTVILILWLAAILFMKYG